MSELYESKMTQDVAGTGLRITPTLITWTETRTFSDFDPNMAITGDDGFFPLEAYLALSGGEGSTSGWAVGDVHPRYPDAVLQSVDVFPQTQDASTHVRASLAYAMPGNFAAVSYDVYQQTETKNFTTPPPTTEGPQLTTVEYSAGPLSSIKISLPPFVADIQIPKLMRAMRITQYEVLDAESQIPAAVLEMDQPVWNSDEVWGYPPGHLLYIGRTSTTEGTKLYRRTYNFLENPYRWDHFFAVYVTQDGLKPADIEPLDPDEIDPDADTVKTNGAAAFKMLQSDSFVERFKKIKPPVIAR